MLWKLGADICSGKHSRQVAGKNVVCSSSKLSCKINSDELLLSFPVDTYGWCAVTGGEGCTPGGSAPFSSWNQAAVKKNCCQKCHRRQIQQMAAAATLGHRFCIFLTVVAPAMIITKAAGPRASSLLYCTLESNVFEPEPLWRVLQQQLKMGAKMCEKKNPLQESVGASVHVCIQVCERQQEGFTTQILSCAVMFHFVIRK